MATIQHPAREITPGLFVGSYESLQHVKELGVTHVLSVLNGGPVPGELLAAVSHVLHVELEDGPDSNLLAALPTCLPFIEEALAARAEARAKAKAEASEAGEQSQPEVGSGSGSGSGSAPRGGVLVHCQAGLSRSVAVVVAHVMKSRGLSSAAEALDIVRCAGLKGGQPNAGFMDQLELFGEMRWCLDPCHPLYRWWAMTQVGRRWGEQGGLDPGDLGQVPGPSGGGLPAGQTGYRCRKCRKLLATSEHVLQLEVVAAGHKRFSRHTAAAAEGGGEGAEEEEVDGDWKQQRQQQQGEEQVEPGRRAVEPAAGAAAAPAAAAGSLTADEPSLFVTPMQWMLEAIVGSVQGKLYCPGPGCSARLGSFNWSGLTTTRGSWVTPGFQLHKDKLDAMSPAADAAALAARIRVPRVGPAAAAAAAAAAATPAGAAALPSALVRQ